MLSKFLNNARIEYRRTCTSIIALLGKFADDFCQKSEIGICCSGVYDDGCFVFGTKGPGKVMDIIPVWIALPYS